MTKQHVTEATLLSYAGGSLGDALSLAVAAHLGACRECRARLVAARAAGGAVLEAMPPAELKPDSLDHLLARLDVEDERARRDQITTTPAPVRDIRLPAPLAHRMGIGHLDEVKWRWLAPGVHTHVIEGPRSAGTLRLLKLAPGIAMPEHGHGGIELTLVLSGAYADETGHYGPGDIADLDEDAEHTPKVEGDEECICLIATEAPTRFKGLIGRIMQPYLGF